MPFRHDRPGRALLRLWWDLLPRPLLISLAGVLLFFAIGPVGFVLLDGIGWFDAFYLTVVTVATVGYGDLVPVSPASRAFAIFVIIGGVGFMYSFVINLAGLFLEGDLRRHFHLLRVQRSIDHLSGHVIICGFGRTGFEAARELATQGQAVVVVEGDPARVAYAEAHGMLALHGDATLDEVLERAGVARAQGLICALPDDAHNVFITLAAREENPGLQIISRASRSDSEEKLRRAGAGIIVSPYVIGGKRMAAAVVRPHVVDFLDVAMYAEHYHLQMEQYAVAAGSALDGQSVADVDVRRRTGAIVLAIRHGERFLANPHVDTRIRAGDILIALGRQEELKALAALAGS